MIACDWLRPVMRPAVELDHSDRAGQVEDVGAGRRIVVTRLQHGWIGKIDWAK
jgi:hypothetical protein